MKNSAREYLLSLIFHETIHAYINYRYSLVLANPRDSTDFKIKFPLFWSMYSGVNDAYSSIYTPAHHEQMAAAYIDTIKALLAPYINPAATQAIKDRVLHSLAWGGLRGTLGWQDLASDTCQIRTDILAAGNYGSTQYHSTNDCSLMDAHAYLTLKLRPPCD